MDMEIVIGEIKAEWEYIGEGICGDYDENDPKDIELLRFTISRLVSQDHENQLIVGWEQIDDASYCTHFPVSTPMGIKLDALCHIMRMIYQCAADGESIKKQCEALSHINPDWISNVAK